MNHHIVDPSFFKDVILMYGTLFDAYFVSGVIVDEFGMQKSKFEKLEIEGSLQTQGTKLVQRSSGNVRRHMFEFYCMSKYRLRIGDFIVYDSKLLHITDMQSFDEYGVRKCDLEMTQLNEHQDLQEFIRTLTGDESI